MSLFPKKSGVSLYSCHCCKEFLWLYWRQMFFHCLVKQVFLIGWKELSV